MPNTYKLSANKIISVGATTLYTAPISTTTLLKSLYISNVTTSSMVYTDVVINKSGSPTDYYLIESASIPLQSTFQPISDTLVLQTGDSIKISTTFSASFDTLLSYLEIT